MIMHYLVLPGQFLHLVKMRFFFVDLFAVNESSFLLTISTISVLLIRGHFGP